MENIQYILIDPIIYRNTRRKTILDFMATGPITLDSLDYVIRSLCPVMYQDSVGHHLTLCTMSWVFYIAIKHNDALCEFEVSVARSKPTDKLFIIVRFIKSDHASDNFPIDSMYALGDKLYSIVTLMHDFQTSWDINYKEF